MKLCTRCRHNEARPTGSWCNSCQAEHARMRFADPQWSSFVPRQVIVDWLEARGIAPKDLAEIGYEHIFRRGDRISYIVADRLAVALGVHVSQWDPYYARVAELEEVA